MKKFLSFITTLGIILLSTIPAFAAGDLPNVIDEADLLSATEEQVLEDYLKQQSEEYQFDVVVLTVNTLDGKTPEAYADDYYDYTGYGYGDRNDGCLLLVSMEDRDWHISTTGFGITALTDAGIDYISGEFLSDLSAGNYYDAFSTYSSTVFDFVERALSGDPYDYDNMDEYDSSYDYNDYYDDEDDLSFGFGTALIIGVVAGLIVTIIVMKKLKSQMKTVYHRAQANNYIVNNSLMVARRYDRLVSRHVSKHARENNSSRGGSSTHSGSSGTSHGGGGGKF